jgi:hypothetical protein
VEIGWKEEGKTNVSEGYIFDEARVKVASFADLLEQGVDHVLEGRILKAAFVGFAEGSSDGERDDDVIVVLGLSVSKMETSAFTVRDASGSKLSSRFLHY